MGAGCCIVPRVVFGMQVGVGRGDVGMPQVVPNHLEVHLIAEMGARFMTHPVGRSLPNMRCGAATAAAADMTDGEIKKVDKSTKKITIKHGDIKSLDMPGMTMVFQVKDLAMLDMVKTGDKVKFKAEKADGAIVVTEMQIAK